MPLPCLTLPVIMIAMRSDGDSASIVDEYMSGGASPDPLSVEGPRIKKGKEKEKEKGKK